MITPIRKSPTKIIIGPAQLSFPHLFTPHKFDSDADKGKYMATVLIPKSEKETIAAIKSAVKAAADAFKEKNGQLPAKFDTDVLRDGADKEDPFYHDYWLLNAKSSSRPGVIDRNNSPITDEEEIYGGVWALVSVNFFGYDAKVKKGVTCGLDNVKKTKDGERFGGGRASAESDFADVELDDKNDEIDDL